MYEDLKRNDKRMVMLGIFLIILSAVMLAVIFLNLFGFVDWIAGSDKRLTPGMVKRYGGGFFAILLVLGVIGLPRALKDSPLKSLENYARAAEQPEATLAALRHTWEQGTRLREWCRMDDTYLIVFLNGAYPVIVPIQEVVWAYQRVARLNGVVKSGTSLEVHYVNGTHQGIMLSEDLGESILQRFWERHREIAVGSGDEVERLWRQKDQAGLREYARQQRAGVEE